MPPADNESPFGEWFAQLCVASGLAQGSHHGQVDFRAGGKIVANLETDGAVTFKLPLDEQQSLLHEYPNHVELPAGWSKHGWTTIRLDALNREHVSELLATAIDTVARARQRKR